MTEDVMRVFVTMHAKGDMRLFDWLRHVEELRYLVAEAVNEKEWGELSIYGPSSDGFDNLPCLCIEAMLTEGALAALLDAVSDCAWLDLPVHIYATRGAVNAD